MLSFTFGTPPAAGATGAGSPSAFGGSGTFHYNITASPTSDVYTLDQTLNDSYNINYALSGASNSGTWVDTGNFSDNVHDSFTVNSDGTATDTYSSGASAMDNFNLNVSGATGAGDSFTVTDTGNDSLSYSDSGTNSSTGGGSDTHSENDSQSYTVNLSESEPGGSSITSTSTESLGYRDNGSPAPGSPGSSSETVTKTDAGSDSSEYQGSGSIDGGTYTTDDKQSDTYNNSDTTTAGAPGGNTENATNDGTHSDTFHLTLSGINDGGGGSDCLNETLTSGGTSHETLTTSPDPSGGSDTVDDIKTTGTSSTNESGADPSGPFSETSSTASTVEAVGTSTPAGTTVGITSTSTPPDQTVTGTPPEDLGSLPMVQDAQMLDETAYMMPGSVASNIADQVGQDGTTSALPGGGGPMAPAAGVPSGAPPAAPGGGGNNQQGWFGWMRMPDYATLNVNIAIPTPVTGTLLGWSGTASVDRYGSVFWSPLGGGVGKSATVVSGSLQGGWLNQSATPSKAKLNSFMSGHGLNVGAGFWGGGGQTWSPGNGTATQLGFATPQLGASYNYSFKAK